MLLFNASVDALAITPLLINEQALSSAISQSSSGKNFFLHPCSRLFGNRKVGHARE